MKDLMWGLAESESRSAAEAATVVCRLCVFMFLLSSLVSSVSRESGDVRRRA